MEYLNQLDHQLFIALNSFHSAFMDKMMLIITDRVTWIPLYLVILFMIFKTNAWNDALVKVLLLILSVGLSDFTTSGLMKPYFERLRPCHDVSLDGLMTLVGNCGGMYGFASSHSANSAALAMGLFLMFKVQWPRFTMIMMVWALVVSYSRVYVGVHFPGDVLTGILIGIFYSFVFCNVIFQQTHKIKQ